MALAKSVDRLDGHHGSSSGFAMPGQNSGRGNGYTGNGWTQVGEGGWRKKQRGYTCCATQGCDSWLFNDRIAKLSKHDTCESCGEPWQTTQAAQAQLWKKGSAPKRNSPAHSTDPASEVDDEGGCDPEEEALWELACKHPKLMATFRRDYSHSRKLKPAKEVPLHEEVKNVTNDWVKTKKEVDSLVAQLDVQTEKANRTREKLVAAMVASNTAEKKLKEVKAKAALNSEADNALPQFEISSDLLDGMRDNKPVVEVWEQFHAKQSGFAKFHAEMTELRAKLLALITQNKPVHTAAVSANAEAAATPVTAQVQEPQELTEK